MLCDGEWDIFNRGRTGWCTFDMLVTKGDTANDKPVTTGPTVIINSSNVRIVLRRKEVTLAMPISCTETEGVRCC